jgi:hypothetical protein
VEAKLVSVHLCPCSNRKQITILLHLRDHLLWM